MREIGARCGSPIFMHHFFFLIIPSAEFKMENKKDMYSVWFQESVFSTNNAVKHGHPLILTYHWSGIAWKWAWWSLANMYYRMQMSLHDIWCHFVAESSFCWCVFRCEGAKVSDGNDILGRNMDNWNTVIMINVKSLFDLIHFIYLCFLIWITTIIVNVTSM